MAERFEVRVADALLALRAYVGPATPGPRWSPCTSPPRPRHCRWCPARSGPRLTLRCGRAATGTVRPRRPLRSPCAPVAEVVAEVGRQAVWPAAVVASRPGSDLRVLNPDRVLPTGASGVVDLPDGPPTGEMVAELRDAQGGAGARWCGAGDRRGPGDGGRATGRREGFAAVDPTTCFAREEHSLLPLRRGDRRARLGRLAASRLVPFRHLGALSKLDSPCARSRASGGVCRCSWCSRRTASTSTRLGPRRGRHRRASSKFASADTLFGDKTSRRPPGPPTVTCC